MSVAEGGADAPDASSSPSSAASADAGSPAPEASADDDTIPGGARWDEAPALVGRGFCMGLAEVIPGVSGGTMAFITGVYPRLIAAIQSIDRAALGHLVGRRFSALRDHVGWRFLVMLGAGQALGIALFSQVLPRWLREAPELVYGVFFGLIVGSIVLLGRDVARRGVTWIHGVAALGGAAFGLAVVTAVPTEGLPDGPVFMLLYGMIAICAMLLPGISGSFVLLILRKYEPVIDAVALVTRFGDGAWVALTTILIPFAIGCAVGIAAFARFLSWLFKRAEQGTLAFVIGILVGTLWVIWPFQERVYVTLHGKEKLLSSSPMWPEALDARAAASAGCVLGGLAIVLAIDILARRRAAAGGVEAPG